MRRGPLIAGALISLVCLAGFWELAEDFGASPAVLRFDVATSAAIQSLRSPAMTLLMRAVTIAAGTVVVSVVTVGLICRSWLRGSRLDAVFVALAVGGGMLLSTIAKGHFDRERPLAEDALIPLPGSASFPSGHAMASVCLGAAIGYIALHSGMSARARAATLVGCMVYAVAVGASRVYLGVHWPSDVIASWLLGGAWLALVIGFAESRR